MTIGDRIAQSIDDARDKAEKADAKAKADASLADATTKSTASDLAVAQGLARVGTTVDATGPHPIIYATPDGGATFTATPAVGLDAPLDEPEPTPEVPPADLPTP